MIVSERERNRLNTVLGVNIFELFMSTRSDAIERIRNAREHLGWVPESVRDRVARALDVLEGMVERFYGSIAERRGPVYEATWLYILSALDPSVEWYKPIAENSEEVLKMLPLGLMYGSIGAKKLAVALSPTKAELRSFLETLNPGDPRLDVVLRRNEHNIAGALEAVLAYVARSGLNLSDDRLTFFGDKVLKVTPEDAARILNKVQNYANLYWLRQSWYEELARKLSEAIGEGVEVHLKKDDPGILVIVKLDNHSRNTGIPFEGWLAYRIEADGIYPRKAHLVEMFTKQVAGVKCDDHFTVAVDVSIPRHNSVDGYVSEMASIVSGNARKALSILEKVAKAVSEFRSRGHPVAYANFIEHYDPVTFRKVTFSLSIDRRADRWDEWTHVRFNESGYVHEISSLLFVNVRSVRHVVDVASWRAEVSKQLAGLADVTIYAKGRRVKVYAVVKTQVVSASEVYEKLMATVSDVFEKLYAARKQYRLGDKEAVAALIAYLVDSQYRSRFEEVTNRSMSEVFMRVGSLLTKSDKPMPGVYTIKDHPEVAVMRLIEAGVVRVTEDGRVYVGDVRLPELVKWAGAPDIEDRFIGKALTEPMLSFMLKTVPELVERRAAGDPRLSSEVVHILSSDSARTIPRDARLKLLMSLAPQSIKVLLESPPDWVLSDSEALATLLYAGGRARDSGRLTSFVVRVCPWVLGGDAQTVFIGDAEFIDRGSFLVLFAGLSEPNLHSKKLFEVYDRRTRRGIMVKADTVNEATEIVSREMRRTVSEYSLLLDVLSTYEEMYGVQIDLTAKNTEGYTIPEVQVRMFENGAEKVVTIPLQPGIMLVLDEVLKKHSQPKTAEREKVTA